MRKRDENKTQFDEKRRQFQENYVMSVSYTHLTLPTT